MPDGKTRRRNIGWKMSTRKKQQVMSWRSARFCSFASFVVQQFLVLEQYGIVFPSTVKIIGQKIGKKIVVQGYFTSQEVTCNSILFVCMCVCMCVCVFVWCISTINSKNQLTTLGSIPNFVASPHALPLPTEND